VWQVATAKRQAEGNRAGLDQPYLTAPRDFAKYLSGKSGNRGVQHYMNLTDSDPSNASHREMAAGVLKQAKNDLRRFYNGTSQVERELYLDAYRWIMSDDCTWPFSFLNVCEIIGISPAHLREELIGDQSLGVFGLGVRRCAKMLSRFQNSLAQVFTKKEDVGATCVG
jgi:hypothetical protein